ncbi:MAG: hypothetical protein ACFFBD_00320 [Candidatus Hodarchaeota archaeon]
MQNLVIKIVSTFVVVQTAIFFISAILLFIVAASVYLRAPKALLNKIFGLAYTQFGLAGFSFGLSNIPIILWEVPGLIPLSKLAYSFLMLGLIIFLISALTIEYGFELTMRPLYLGPILCVLIANLIIIWLFPDSIYHPGELGDIHTSLLFKVVYFCSLATVYFLTLFLYFKTFKSSKEEIIKNNMRWFLLGWLIGGFLLVTGALSDFIRVLDLAGYPLLAAAGFIQRQAFRKKEEEK